MLDDCAEHLSIDLVPLPVSRVRETGVVQVSEGSRQDARVHETGMLIEVFVRDGQQVSEGADLAKFHNAEFEFKRKEYETERDAAERMANALQRRLTEAGGDPATRAKLDTQLREARQARHNNAEQLRNQEELIRRTEILKAPRSGTVMGAPKKEDIFRTWEKADPQPVCTIGDPKKMRLLIPVGPTDYREMKRNLDRKMAEQPDEAYLEVSILAKNHKEYKGRITRLPDTDEKNVPLPLTHRGGGSIATKPGGDPNVNQPLIQTYLVVVEMDDPDDSLTPGTLATAKVHLEWKSAAWWAWRSIASALDVALW